jgi:hypothetical protein
MDLKAGRVFIFGERAAKKAVFPGIIDIVLRGF